jgi:hypothetical protein
MAAKLARVTHKIIDTTARSGRELYCLQFSLQAASPETFGYTLVHVYDHGHTANCVAGRSEQRANVVLILVGTI